MDLNWLQSIFYGFVSGLMDILPVSAQAHRQLLLKFYGVDARSDLLALMIHLGIFAALYFSCSQHIVRMSRAKRLSKIPKKRRKRPLDVRSLMDLSLLKTILIPVVLGLVLMQYTGKLQDQLFLTAIFLFLNGIILYAPQFMPTGNRDSRNLSRVEGLLMGLGGGISILPGISAMGAAVSIASVCGVERSYGLSMAILMNLFVNLGYLVYDVLGILSGGAGTVDFIIVMRYVLTGVAAAGGTLLGIRVMRGIAANHGYSLFGLYCIGMALFTFVLNLIS